MCSLSYERATRGKDRSLPRGRRCLDHSIRARLDLSPLSSLRVVRRSSADLRDSIDPHGGCGKGTVGIAFWGSLVVPEFASRCNVFLVRTFQNRRPRFGNAEQARGTIVPSLPQASTGGYLRRLFFISRVSGRALRNHVQAVKEFARLTYFEHHANSLLIRGRFGSSLLCVTDLHNTGPKAVKALEWSFAHVYITLSGAKLRTKHRCSA